MSELGIAEHNLFTDAGAFGLSAGVRRAAAAIGTVYDRSSAVPRFAELRCYQDARFMLVATRPA